MLVTSFIHRAATEKIFASVTRRKIQLRFRYAGDFHEVTLKTDLQRFITVDGH